jgi:hypothetical protein
MSPLTLSSPPEKPTTLAELFAFYHEYVKLLYSYVQTSNTLPVETLFELNAAFDHISRIWAYQEKEAIAVQQAYGHLKRSCLDIFKLVMKDTRSNYDQLLKLDTSAIDNGEFDKEMRALFARIKSGALEARRLEGDQVGDGKVMAFDRWQPVFADCLKFEQTFFLHKHVDWAHHRYLGRLFGSRIVAGLLGAVIGVTLKFALERCFS